MGQIDHVLPLATACRTVLPGKETVLADPEDAAHPIDRKAGPFRFDEAEGHRLPSFAKKAVAFSGYCHSPGKQSTELFPDPAQMPQNRILPPQPFQFRIQIDRCLTRLGCIALLTKPSRQRRQPDA